MIIDAVSDLHGGRPELGGGDLLILGGDYTRRGDLREWNDFLMWVKGLEYEKIVMIGGDHDEFMEARFPNKASVGMREVVEYLDCRKVKYLYDGWIRYKGLKIWGSPWSGKFSGMNPACRAFTGNEKHLGKRFGRIQEDVDILVTHSPPYMVLDRNKFGVSCGSISLRNELEGRIRPKLHFFGHIHEGRGKRTVFKREIDGRRSETICCNVSWMDGDNEETGVVTRVEV